MFRKNLKSEFFGTLGERAVANHVGEHDCGEFAVFGVCGHRRRWRSYWRSSFFAIDDSSMIRPTSQAPHPLNRELFRAKHTVIRLKRVREPSR